MRKSNLKVWVAAIAGILAIGVVALVGVSTAAAQSKAQSDKSTAPSSDKADGRPILGLPSSSPSTRLATR
jgi:hypothetical protein